MKTKLLFLFSILSFSFTNAQIVNIPDPVLKAKLLQLNSTDMASTQTPIYNNVSGWWGVSSYTSIDSNEDGEIQESEAQAIKWLAITDLSISDVTGIEAFINLEYLSLSNNQLQSFNILNLTHLRYLNVGHNYLQSLDVTTFSSLRYMWCYNNNQMKSLFMKNNANWVSLGFDANWALEYICADENDLTFVQNKIDENNLTNCNVNSYCSFTPGGTFYTINGNNRRDLNNNGCDATDDPYPNLKLKITNGSQTGTIICNDQGNYSIPVQAGTHTLTPVLENPNYFTAEIPVISFPASASPFNQDFCITANGIHHDVEVTVIPTGVARPGFNAYYKIVFKNKATAIESGSIQFSFDDAVLDFVSANPSFSTQTTNILTWDYLNLQPLETRTIMLVLNVNSPMETPAVNIDDQLNYQAIITTPNTDEMLSDNTFVLNQTVVGAYDPNDKICLQGESIAPSYIGEYVHYMIRFENTGTYPAENVVVKDIIDSTKFDITTLQTIATSHSCNTRINGNTVEFIFENINLPFDNANNDGYVTFKIKTKPNLVLGNTFSNLANIYFDYNFPIVTNNFTSTIQNALSIDENNFNNDISVYPNPVKNMLQFKTEAAILKVEVYDITGRIISSKSINENKIDLSELKTGNYILKLYTEKGITNTKIIKE